MKLFAAAEEKRKANTYVYAIFDNQAERYTMPLYYPAKGAAIRAFAQAVNGGDKQISACPQDFSLYELGSYDEHLGMIEVHSSPVRIVIGLEVKEVQQ